jgi:putative ABC transport system permease protein
MLADTLFRLRALFRRSAVERELDDELRFHVEHEVEKHVAAGMPRDQATRRASLEFGGVEQVKEECRDARGVSLPETVLQDLRYGLRTMRRAPVFTATAILTVALSTAALATVFTLGDALLLRPLPVDGAEEVVVVSSTRGQAISEGLVSYPDYVTFRDGARTLSDLAAHYPTAPLFVTANGNAREIGGAVVSANFFPLLRVKPALGRFFRDDEDRVPDRDRVAVLSHHLWSTWFGASPDAIGSSVKINGTVFTVIGVAPSTFVGITNSPVEIYIPVMTLRTGYRWCDDSLAASCTVLAMIGRLAPGRTAEESAAELTTLMPRSWINAPKGENSGIAVAHPRGATSDGSQIQLMRVLIAVAIVLLLVCCANIAGLLTAQGAARHHEFGIRLSLGASRARIVRQFMTESLMLALAGGAGGLILSRAFVVIITTLFYAVDDEGHPRYFDFSLTPGIVVAALAASAAAGCLFSALPAIKSAMGGAGARAVTRSSTGRWSSGRWLLGAQASIAVALVATAALLATSASLAVNGSSSGSSHVALMRLRPRLMNYSAERAQQFQREVVQRLSAVPGVESVSMVGVGAVLGGGVTLVGLQNWTRDQCIRTGYNEIGPRYFETLRTPILSGREFDERDTLQSPRVAIVSESLARRLWPNGSPIGATIVARNGSQQVVGVVADARMVSRTEPVQPFVYVPFWQNPQQIDSRMAIRVAGDPASSLPALVREVGRVDPDVPIAETLPLSLQLIGWARPVRLTAMFVGYSAGLAVLLTGIGLYGTLAFAVSLRTREIGIRMALGAARTRVVALIVREGMTVVVAGACAGVVLAAGASRFVAHLLYGSADADWLFYAAAAAVVLSVGLAASLMPAQRAAGVEPLVALRHE